MVWSGGGRVVGLPLEVPVAIGIMRSTESFALLILILMGFVPSAMTGLRNRQHFYYKSEEDYKKMKLT